MVGTQLVDTLRDSIVTRKEKLPLETLDEIEKLVQKGKELWDVEPYYDITSFYPISYVARLGFEKIAANIGRDIPFVVENVKNYLLSQKAILYYINVLFDDGTVEADDDDENLILRCDYEETT